MLIKAIYPGTFDPITNGHINLIERGASLFDQLIVSVADNPDKQPLFSLTERIILVKKTTTHITNVCVCGFKILLVDHAKNNNTKIILRGLRNISDFELEFQLANINHNLYSELESVFLLPVEQYSFISSSSVREIAKLGGDVTSFVHPFVKQALDKKFPKNNKY